MLVKGEGISPNPQSQESIAPVNFEPVAPSALNDPIMLEGLIGKPRLRAREMFREVKRKLTGTRQVQISVRVHEDMSGYKPALRHRLKNEGLDTDTTYTFTKDVRVPKGAPKPIIPERAYVEADEAAVETPIREEQAYANSQHLNSLSSASEREVRVYLNNQTDVEEANETVEERLGLPVADLDKPAEEVSLEVMQELEYRQAARLDQSQ